MIKYILLGIIQGLTEFFPVSSSAHLVIFQKLFGMHGQEVALSVILHLGTVLALLVFFFKDILKLLSDKKMLLMVMLVTLLTGAIGIKGKDFFESLFTSVKPVAIALMVTGTMLILTKKFMQAKRTDVNFKDAFILGITQGIAIIPGISRSGTTISTLLFRKIDKETAFKFSFLASIPAIMGATLLEAKKVGFALKADFKDFFIGFLASFIVGFFALCLLKLAMQKAKLHYFGYYCIIVGITVLLFLK